MLSAVMGWHVSFLARCAQSIAIACMKALTRLTCPLRIRCAQEQLQPQRLAEPQLLAQRQPQP